MPPMQSDPLNENAMTGQLQHQSQKGDQLRDEVGLRLRSVLASFGSLETVVLSTSRLVREWASDPQSSSSPSPSSQEDNL